MEQGFLTAVYTNKGALLSNQDSACMENVLNMCPHMTLKLIQASFSMLIRNKQCYNT